MLRKQIDIYRLFIFGLGITILGTVLLCEKDILMNKLFVVLGYFILILGIVSIISIIISKSKKTKTNIILSLINVVFGFLSVYGSNILIDSVVLVYEIYLLLTVASHIVNFYIYKKYKIKGKIRIIISIIYNLTFMILIYVDKAKNLSIILGIYLIILGLGKLANFIIEITPKEIKNKIYIPLPLFLNALIPGSLLKEVIKRTKKGDYEFLNYSKTDAKPDIEVLIHLSNESLAYFGHIEVAYKNKVYSYGNYDKHSRSLWEGIGDGVILIANKTKYIKYCVMNRNRRIVSFGIKLNEQEKKLVEKRIDKLINTNTIDFYSDLYLAEQGQIEKKDYHDMSSEVYKYAEANFKKIISGKEKKFFALKTNCAMVASYILSSVNQKIIGINGLITPGSYYDYLNNKLISKKSNVISRKIYTKKDFKAKFE